ncbi:MAG: amidohydrolase family protein [Planctomycetes bacterium]|nr:amidohydrolase family protein [Planctomycetota bacterium]
MRSPIPSIPSSIVSARTTKNMQHKGTQSRFPGSIARSFSLALFAAVIAQGASAQVLTAVKAGKLWLGNGKTLDNAVVLIEDGRITKVGANVEIPMNATVVDASKKFVMPAYVLANSSGGMDRENENMPVTPYLNVLDSLDPSSSAFDLARRFGIGTLHVLPGDATVVGGRGMILKPYGKTPEEMALVERAAMKVSLQPKNGSRSTQVAQLRRAFDDAKNTRAQWEQAKKDWEEEKKNGATNEEEFGEKLDELKQPLLDVLDRKTRLWLYVPAATDVPAALRFVQDYKTDTVFVLGSSCFKAVDLLQQAMKLGVEFILDDDLEYIEKDPITQDETLICPAKELFDAGIPFAITTASPSARMRFGNSRTSPTQQIPSWQIATCVRNGVPQRAAIAALTAIPARILRLEKQVGEVAVGFDGNLQVLTAAPLEPESQVESLIVEGKVIYERSKDARYAELTGETKSAANEDNR